MKPFSWILFISMGLPFMWACQGESANETGVPAEMLSGRWELIEGSADGRDNTLMMKGYFFDFQDDSTMVTTFTPSGSVATMGYTLSADGRTLSQDGGYRAKFRVSFPEEDRLDLITSIPNPLDPSRNTKFEMALQRVGETPGSGTDPQDSLPQ